MLFTIESNEEDAKELQFEEYEDDEGSIQITLLDINDEKRMCISVFYSELEKVVKFLSK